MPPVLRLAVGALLVLAGALLVVIAVLGHRTKLPRNRFAGVRTAATLATAEAFAVANRVAAPAVGAAGAVALAGGAVLLSGATGVLGWVLLVVAAFGSVALTGVGGAIGDRAARLVAARDEPSPCAGACAGCELIAGCATANGAADPAVPHS